MQVRASFLNVFHYRPKIQTPPPDKQTAGLFAEKGWGGEGSEQLQEKGWGGEGSEQLQKKGWEGRESSCRKRVKSRRELSW